MSTTGPDRKARRRERGSRQPSADSPEGAPRSALWWRPALLARSGATATFALALAGGLLLWASLPPLRWWPLGWLAPFCWLLLIRREQLPGRRPYCVIWLASVIYWVVLLQGIRLAHWANYIGLVALASYLGIYLPLFVAVARVAYHRWRVPLIVAAPVVWTAMELTRGYGPLAFSVALLADSQVNQPLVIQVADLLGPYTVSFVIMCVASGAVAAWPTSRRGWRLAPLLLLAVLVAATLGYGRYRLRETPPGRARPAVRVAIIQGAIDTVFEDNPERPRETLDQYTDLTVGACEQYQPLDLILWPETMFPIDDLLVADDCEPVLDAPWNRATIEDVQRIFQRHVNLRVRLWNEAEDGAIATRERPTSWIFGVPTWQFGDFPSRRYNTAILVTPQAQIVGRYFKMRPVIFGEYVPFGDVIPALYHLFPMPNGLTAGSEPVVWDVAGLRMSPSICFESTMPQLIRRQVAELSRRGATPDVLVNLTNDGWFWGSSILDLQLSCAIFRAVEMRRPLLVAANTGFSAWIDGNGTVLAQGPRRATGTLLAEVTPDGRTSWYEKWGDAPWFICVLFCLLLALDGVCHRGRAR